MTKKIVSWLSFMTVFLFLYSCRQELLQNERDYALKSRQSTIEQLLRSQLEKKAPQIIYKVDRLQVNKPSGNARIYTDAENGFSVDTEKAMYIEDANGNKTYTFKIERDTENPLFLENLMLEETGNTEYAAYIVKYDKMAVENMGSIAPADLKNHITFTPLGTRTGAEIFGKYDANSSCNVMMPYASNWVYVGGTLCYSGDHDYAHIGDCNYQSVGKAGPTQGYYTYEVSYAPVDICGSGGSSGGVGTTPTNGGGTTPIGGGGGGNGTFIDVTDPCNILKNDLLLAKQIINKTNIKAQNNSMTATIVNDDNEKGFSFGKDMNGAYQVSPVIELGVNGGSIPLTGLGFVAEGDFHNHNGPTAPPCPSPPDMYDMFTAHVALPSYFIRFVNGSDGSMYALTINSESNMDQFIQDHPKNTNVDLYHPTNNPNGNNFWKDNSEIYKDFYKVAQYFVDKDETQSNAYAYGMAYVTQKYNMGMVISQKDSSGNFRPLGIKVKINQFDPEKTEYELIHPCNL